MRWFMALAFAGAFAFQAQAQEQGMALLCDTPEQVETVVREFARTKNQEAALGKANKEAGSDDACVVQQALYIPGKEIKRLSSELGEVAIYDVMVLHWGPPTPQFMARIIRVGSGA